MVEAHDPLLGATLAGNYILERVLGEGGMGRVYLARHTRINAKRFAIKVLHKEYAQHQEALERFKREAEAAALIQSPNVVSVYDYGAAPDGRPYLVSDFLVGEELADRLKREMALPVGEAVRIVRQVCAGLAYAHANGVIHRDVKPENVFLVGSDEDLTVKLLDFGISRMHDSGDKGITKAGIALGTPDFMAPEQAKGKTVDHRTDIYAVGTMLYVMLTGCMPFERDSPQDTLLALLAEDPAPMSMFDDSIPAELEAIVAKAMAKEMDARFPWIVQLSQALAPFDPTAVAGQPVPASAPAASSQQTLAEAPLLAPPPAPTPRADLGAARGWIAATLGFGAPFGWAVLLLALVGILDAAGLGLSLTAWLVVGLATLLALATPFALALRHVSKVLWNDAEAASRAATRLRGTMLAGAGAYAGGALLLRLLAAAVLDEPLGLVADTGLAVFTVLAALVGFAMSKPSS